MIADTSVSALIFLVSMVKELVFDASSKAAILSLTLAVTTLLNLIDPGVNPLVFELVDFHRDCHLYWREHCRGDFSLLLFSAE